MKRHHSSLPLLIGLILSSALAMLGHFYVVYLPQYRVDAFVFYAAGGLIGWWVYGRLDASRPRHRLIYSVVGHVGGLCLGILGGGLAWLGLLVGGGAVLAAASLWVEPALSLYQSLQRMTLYPGHLTEKAPDISEEGQALMDEPALGLGADAPSTLVPSTETSGADASTAQRPRLGLVASGLAFGLALMGQLLLNQHTSPLPGTLLYLAAGALLAAGLWLDQSMWPGQSSAEPALELQPAGGTVARPSSKSLLDSSWQRAMIGLAAASGAIAFIFSGENTFTTLGVVGWLISVNALMLALWEGELPGWLRGRPGEPGPKWVDLRGIHLRWRTLLIVGLIGLGVFFRFYNLAELPAEMNSDHAEKLLDVQDILHGQRPIFFSRNTGREAWQFYWTVGLIRLFGLPPDFQTLKIGSSLIGSLMLPGLYVLGAEVLGPLGGMWALLFGGVTSWSVITTRFGLRYPFMQMPVTWTLAFLARALRREQRNDFLLMGLIWGIGFYGYQSYRAMAGALPAAFVTWYVLSGRWRKPDQRQLWANVASTLSVAGLVLVPMIRFSLDYPELFWTRILSRLTGSERPIEGSPLLIFADNVRRALLSFFWYGDEVWVAGIPNVPIIDPILGALIVCGLVTLLVWSLRRKDALPVALIAAALVMTAPSAAALAFPRENPSAIRLGGMIPSVMVLCAALPTLALGTWWETASHSRRRPAWPAMLAAGLLGLAVVGVNGQRTFDTYARSYCARSLNASEAAQAIQGFIRTGGPPPNAMFVAFSHWFDSRAIGIWLGDINWPNTVMDIQAGGKHLPARPGPMLFIVHPEDTKTLAYLWQVYPNGWSSRQPSQRCAGHDFITFYVPASERGSE